MPRRLEPGVSGVMQVVTVPVRRRDHPYWRGQFMLATCVGLEELLARVRDHSLGMQAVSVLLAMMAHCDYDNVVRPGHKDLSRMLEMAPSSVTRAIQALLDCGFVERGRNGRGRYTLSPHLCWKGDEKSLRKALAERGMLDKNGMMRREAA